MYLNILLLVGLGLCVVMLTRLLVRGIELFAAAGYLSSKSKGQFLGYATSMPEMVGTLGTAGHGLIGAGLWNIGSSNIINVGLFWAAAFYYRRTRALFKRKFLDEMGFAFLALAIPLILSRDESWSQSPWTAAGLFALFLTYIYVDKRLNPNPPPSVAQSYRRGPQRSMKRAMVLIVVGVIGIVAAGNFLGHVAAAVVHEAGVPQWAVGWILGLITSLPEMTAFFAIFAAARNVGIAEDDDTDCQENLDSLAASNMSNLGLIYPLGIGVFLLIGLR